jgi:hypothetical protein
MHKERPPARLKLQPGETIAPRFTPVPMVRNRHDGWTRERQEMFIMALSVVGSVDAAARMTKISRKSAYALRNRPGAESFARAWDIAIMSGRARVFDYLMERALNGVTTLRLRLGGAVDISHGMDGDLITRHLKAPLPHEDRFGGAADTAKGDIR